MNVNNDNMTIYNAVMTINNGIIPVNLLDYLKFTEKMRWLPHIK